MINLTDAAKEKFLAAAESEGRKGQGLRVTVNGGGTAQPEFALNFVEPDHVRDDDVADQHGELTIYMDPQSAKFLEAATIDFVETLAESGFKIDAPNAGIPRPTGPVAEAVQRCLDEKINPGVASHGGFIDLVAVENETAYLKFGGGCQGCGMVNVTLKQGVEKILFQEVPQITKVMDITDHASGTNPYYQPGK
ncbi:MAG: iron-sulfur cluster assembly accessory protein [bacterium]|nr:iron-sulfur cluster assembly accessory protein [bacterium]